MLVPSQNFDFIVVTHYTLWPISNFINQNKPHKTWWYIQNLMRLLRRAMKCSTINILIWFPDSFFYILLHFDILDVLLYLLEETHIQYSNLKLFIFFVTMVSIISNLVMQATKICHISHSLLMLQMTKKINIAILTLIYSENNVLVTPRMNSRF